MRKSILFVEVIMFSSTERFYIKKGLVLKTELTKIAGQTTKSYSTAFS